MSFVLPPLTDSSAAAAASSLPALNAEIDAASSSEPSATGQLDPDAALQARRREHTLTLLLLLHSFHAWNMSSCVADVAALLQSGVESGDSQCLLDMSLPDAESQPLGLPALYSVLRFYTSMGSFATDSSDRRAEKTAAQGTFVDSCRPLTAAMLSSYPALASFRMPDSGNTLVAELLQMSLPSAPTAWLCSLIREMCAAGVPVDARNATGCTALLTGAQGAGPIHTRAIFVSVLSDCGADLNAQDSQGSSLLHTLVTRAAADLTADLLSLPIAHSIDLHLHNASGLTAAELATQRLMEQWTEERAAVVRVMDQAMVRWNNDVRVPVLEMLCDSAVEGGEPLIPDLAQLVISYVDNSGRPFPKRSIEDSEAASSSATAQKEPPLPARPESPPVMPLSSLADIELRLVSQCLPAVDLLSFARCNHRTLHAADDPFAWTHSPIDVRTDQLPLLPQSRLLRHAPIALLWTSHLFTLSDLQSQLQPSQRIVSIDTRRATRLEWSFWLLLDDPCFEHLTTVLMHTESNSNRVALTPDMMRALTALPLLRTLSILHLTGYPQQECWSLLPRCANLTDLSVCDGHEQREALPRHAHVAQCLRLRRLHLLYPLLYGSAFLRFFGSASLSALEDLTLDLFRCRGNGYQQLAVPATEYRASFAALRSLRSLHLIRCDSIDALLVHVSAAPQLSRVRVQPSYCDWFEPEVSAVGAPCTGVPSAAALSALLSAAPQLTVQLVLRSDTGAKPEARQYKPTPEEIRRVRKLWAACAHSPLLQRAGLSPRFEVAVRFGPLDSAHDEPPHISEFDACTVQ